MRILEPMSSTIPFPAPPSLESTIRSFHQDPADAIRRLEAMREKRRTDPVLNAWLCWAYLNAGDRPRALRAALRAELQAPGSPLTSQLRYLCLHPDGFGAFDPAWTTAVDPQPGSVDFRSGFDLDGLIHKLTHVGKTKIRPESDGPSVDMADVSAKRGTVRTATMAAVHEKQGRLAEALAIYEHLSEIRPAKAAQYAPHIERLKASLGQTD